jgi:hypothetical protein
MILPRFSLRWLMLATAVFAVLSVIASRAIQGNALALGFTVALGSGVFLLLLFALAFGFASLLRMLLMPRDDRGSSPFGESVLPQQVIVPPQDVD